MNRKKVLEELELIFKDILDDDAIVINETTCNEDIPAWDSLAQISILEVVQEEFNVKFTIDEMIELTDVGKILDAISRQIEL